MKVFFLTTAACLVLLVGCGDNTWREAPTNYACTEEQAKRVAEESEWCARNTNFHGGYCYGAAIMRICSKIPKETK